MSGHRVVIVGGGITGLSVAYYLKQWSQQNDVAIDCTVMERDSRFGGKILTHRQEGFVLEDGPESMLARKVDGIQLIQDLGLESEIVNTVATNQRTFVLNHGELQPLPAGTNMGIPVRLRPFFESPVISQDGKIRALADLFLPAGPDVPDETLGSLLRRRFGDELVTSLIEPLLAGIYAGSVDDLSVNATFPQFRQLEREHRSLILGSIRAQKTLASQSPLTTPAETGRSAFVTLRGGLSTLIERLYEQLCDWAHLVTNAEVNQLSRANPSVWSVSGRIRGEAQSLPADAVIITTPAFHACQLLQTLIPSATALSDIPYVSTATVILGFWREDAVGMINGSGFVVPRQENRGITACTYMSEKWAHIAPSAYTVIRCYVGRAGQTEGLQLTDDDMVGMAREEIKKITGLNATPLFSRVTRWPDAMPQYRVGHLEHLECVESDLSLHAPGVFLAGGGYRGVGIPDCIRQAKNVVTSLIGQFSSADPMNGVTPME